MKSAIIDGWRLLQSTKMSIKVILYVLVTAVIVWALDGININRIFKQNRIWQATVFYVALVMALSYLVVNFLYDFFVYVRFI